MGGKLSRLLWNKRVKKSVLLKKRVGKKTVGFRMGIKQEEYRSGRGYLRRPEAKGTLSAKVGRAPDNETGEKNGNQFHTG